jgi:hypothetical protein
MTTRYFSWPRRAFADSNKQQRSIALETVIFLSVGFSKVIKNDWDRNWFYEVLCILLHLTLWQAYPFATYLVYY